MQNRYLKGAIVSSFIAIATGVLLFGINATFGAPTYQPPGDSVKPTFNGMTTTGSIDAQGGITNSKSLPVLISAPYGIDVRGNIKNGSTDQVSVDGNLYISGQLKVDNIYDAFKGFIGIYSPLTVTKDATFNANIDAQGVIKNTTGVGGVNPVKVDDSLDVTGELSNSAGFFTINDTDGIYIRGPINDPTAEPVIINDSNGVRIDGGGLDIRNGYITNNYTGFAQPVTISDPDGINLLGKIFNNNLNSAVEIDDPEGLKLDSGNLDIQLGSIVNTTPGQPVKITDPDGIDVRGNISNLINGKAVVISDSDGLDVRGPITNSTDIEVVIDNNLRSTGSLETDTYAKISQWLTVLGKATIFDLLTAKKGITVESGNLNFATVAGGNISNAVEISNANSISSPNKNLVLSAKDALGNILSSLTVNGSNAKVDVKGALNVTGKVTATGGFGTFTPRPSAAAVTVIPNSYGTASATCIGSEILLSCSMWNAGGGFINSILPNGKTCSGYIFNNSDVNTSIKMYATCFDQTQ
ncbi:MAG: hypothetical protein Q8P62_03785 [Candidatus Peregrinibacteria bacterium]|nr:hypothetical protein [Candidatus Peregrinibacteria bacterium]